jgi:hypothetical protein
LPPSPFHILLKLMPKLVRHVCCTALCCK